jgi:hypothetical protein
MFKVKMDKSQPFMEEVDKRKTWGGRQFIPEE